MKPNIMAMLTYSTLVKIPKPTSNALTPFDKQTFRMPNVCYVPCSATTEVATWVTALVIWASMPSLAFEIKRVYELCSPPAVCSQLFPWLIVILSRWSCCCWMNAWCEIRLMTAVTVLLSPPHFACHPAEGQYKQSVILHLADEFLLAQTPRWTATTSLRNLTLDTNIVDYVAIMRSVDWDDRDESWSSLSGLL